MPYYDYACGACEGRFNKFQKIADRKLPESEPCPHCAVEGQISMLILGAPIASDSIRLGLKKPDSGFKEVIQKIHNGVAGSTLNKSRILNE